MAPSRVSLKGAAARCDLLRMRRTLGRGWQQALYLRKHRCVGRTLLQLKGSGVLVQMRAVSTYWASCSGKMCGGLWPAFFRTAREIKWDLIGVACWRNAEGVLIDATRHCPCYVRDMARRDYSQ